MVISLTLDFSYMTLVDWYLSANGAQLHCGRFVICIRHTAAMSLVLSMDNDDHFAYKLVLYHSVLVYNSLARGSFHEFGTQNDNILAVFYENTV